jgi:7-keto-8-aminopelargonate synthetase-like enzyme
VELIMGAFSKSFASLGGFIATHTDERLDFVLEACARMKKALGIAGQPTDERRRL